MLSVDDEVIPLLISVFQSEWFQVSFIFIQFLLYPQRDAGKVQKNYIATSHINRTEALLQPDEHLAFNQSAFVCKPEYVGQH